MALDVSDLMGSTDSSTDNDNSDTETETEVSLAPVFEEIGADLDRVRAFIKEQDKADEIEQFAKALKEDGDLCELMEEYRRAVDQKRILQNWLYDYDGDFSSFADEFWGDSDDPEPGTFNDIQQRARASKGNLYYYKQMFPEPVEEYWPTDAVLYVERPDDDSHIYVTEDFVDNFAQFTMEIDGKEVPRPPTDSELAEMESESDDSGNDDSDDLPAVPIDTTEVTIAELEDELEHLMPGLSVEQVENLITHEKANKDRKGAKQALETALEAAEKQADDSTDESGDEEQASIGRLAGETGEHPDVIRGMREEGLDDDQIRNILG
jgi:hypothetical protein